MIRRTKKEVLPDLPAKTRTVIPLPMASPANYKQALMNTREALSYTIGGQQMTIPEGGKHINALTQIERLKQCAVAEKLPAAITWIKDYMEAEDKLVIFTKHHIPQTPNNHSSKKYNPWVIDGRVPVKKRDPIIRQFQENPKYRIIIIAIKAGMGIDLTAANATCFVELGWTPGEHDQAEDRVQGIRQEANKIIAY